LIFLVIHDNGIEDTEEYPVMVLFYAFIVKRVHILNSDWIKYYKLFILTKATGGDDPINGGFFVCVYVTSDKRKSPIMVLGLGFFAYRVYFVL
jgi:hypothetical protein